MKGKREVTGVGLLSSLLIKGSSEFSDFLEMAQLHHALSKHCNHSIVLGKSQLL